MKNVFKKISAITAAFVLLGSGTSATSYPAPHSGNISVVNAAELVQSVYGSNYMTRSQFVTAIYNKEGNPSALFFKPCDPSFTSIVDALKSIGVDSSMDYRKKIAEANGITNYKGTAKQNTTMLDLLKRGKLRVPGVKIKFNDVRENDFFAQSVVWATQNGITSGISNDKFGPYQGITREQVAVMLYKYACIKNIPSAICYSYNPADLITFPDDTAVSGWAKTAMGWAISNDVISLKGRYLDPKGLASNAECEKFIYNL